jgi:RNA polymerase sigma-70 factor (ECF subfamily)
LSAGRTEEPEIADSIEDLFRAHWPLVVGYLHRRTGDATLAEDLAAETFTRAVGAFLGWRGESAAGWLLAIARNVHLDHARRARRVVAFDVELLVERSDVVPAVDRVEEVLAALPDASARVLRLVHGDGFSHAEVAVMTGSTPVAVRTAVWRARQEFRITWAQLFGEDHESTS